MQPLPLEKSNLIIEVNNEGKGDANNLKIEIASSEGIDIFSFDYPKTIKAKSSQKVKILFMCYSEGEFNIKVNAMYNDEKGKVYEVEDTVVLHTKTVKPDVSKNLLDLPASIKINEKAKGKLYIENISDDVMLNVETIMSGVSNATLPTFARIDPHKKVTHEFELGFDTHGQKLIKAEVVYEDIVGKKYSASQEQRIIVHPLDINPVILFNIPDEIISNEETKCIAIIENRGVDKILDAKIEILMDNKPITSGKSLEKMDFILKPEKIGAHNLIAKLLYKDELGKQYTYQEEKKILVVPKSPKIDLEIEVKQDKIAIGEDFDLVVRLINKGSGIARKVKVNSKFPSEFEVQGELENVFKEISPNTKRVIQYSLKPLYGGDFDIKDIAVKYEDELGRELSEKIKPIYLSVLEKEDIVIEKELEGVLIKRGYSSFGDKIKFGVKVENYQDKMLYNVIVRLRPPSALTITEPASGSDATLKISSLDPNSSESAIFYLKPDRCVSGIVKGTVEYDDPITGELKTISIKPKRIESICPFVQPLPLEEIEYVKKVNSGIQRVQTGYSFKGVDINTVSKIIKEACNNLFPVLGDGKDIENTRILYLSGESKVQKLYYLLTSIIEKNEDIINIAFLGYSDNEFGLAGFISEITENVRYSLQAISKVSEISKMEVNQVVNIIDSVVQRSEIKLGKSGTSGNINIKDSMVQRTSIGD